MQLKEHCFVSFLLTIGLLLFGLTPIQAKAEGQDVSRFELRINDRKVQMEKNTIRLTQGESVELVWSSDEAGELHLHGYDISFRVSPEAPVTIRFVAHATGRFPVTSHGFEGHNGDDQRHGHAALLYIEVYPD